jgi:hypothetical protein
MPKPIVFLGASIPAKEHENLVKRLKEAMPDYYVLVYHSHPTEMQVFYEKDFTDIQYDELKALIEERLNDAEVKQEKLSALITEKLSNDKN